MSNAIVIPLHTASAMMCHGWTIFVQTNAAMLSEIDIEQSWVTTMTDLFG
jgi:hypothetical protein